MTDSKFMLTFTGLLVFFVALTFGIYFLAAALSTDINYKLSEDALNAMSERTQQTILPVATFAVGDPSNVVASTATAGGSSKSGEEAYNGVCAACHNAGLAGAPKLADEASWTERLAKGMETLYASAINGIGAMPAKGGSTDDDDVIKKAVDYMVAAVDPSIVPEIEAEETMPAESEEAVSIEMGDDNAETVVAATDTSANRQGEELYNTACGFCHNAGVAGAPKIADAVVWKDRIAKGMDALYSSAINGIGAMPAKGGSSAEDDAVKAAVDYMVSQSQ